MLLDSKPIMPVVAKRLRSSAPHRYSRLTDRAANAWEAMLLLDIPDECFPLSPAGCFGYTGDTAWPPEF